MWLLSLLKLRALSSLPSSLSFSPLRTLFLQTFSHKGQHWIQTPLIPEKQFWKQQHGLTLQRWVWGLLWPGTPCHPVVLLRARLVMEPGGCHAVLLCLQVPAEPGAAAALVTSSSLSLRAQSEAVVCGICMDRVYEKPRPEERLFGILPNCSHPYCVGCIRKWRRSRDFQSTVIK